MSYKGDSEGYKGFLSATDGLKEDRQGDIKSQSIEHILSSSIQRAKEKISLMEHRERNERSQGNHGSL